MEKPTKEQIKNEIEEFLLRYSDVIEIKEGETMLVLGVDDTTLALLEIHMEEKYNYHHDSISYTNIENTMADLVESFHSQIIINE